MQSVSFVKIILIRDIQLQQVDMPGAAAVVARQSNACNVDSAFVSLWLEHVNLVTDNSHDSAQ